ncbi:putative F-box protein At5g55150 [Daucus carota subsp. sativus]|nr:PREDICTED: putative F-box protein At5g55150 [Daucus carota subsp. sativus]
MVIYGECSFLGYARLGEKSWTNVNISSRRFYDIAFYQGKFYAIDCHGDVFVCDIDDDGRAEQIKGTKIASCPPKRESGDFDMKYLVESDSGLWLVERFLKTRYVKPPNHTRRIFKYCTTHFLVSKLELNYSGDCVETPCRCIPQKSLGDEAFFIGSASSVSLQSSEYIRPNSIYFTDNVSELFNHSGGGHDMGIFSMETGTIEPHFQGKSLHPISPPLWYI